MINAFNTSNADHLSQTWHMAEMSQQSILQFEEKHQKYHQVLLGFSRAMPEQDPDEWPYPLLWDL